MALVGGGGSGFSNTVNPTGTGAGLNYIGNHAYAFSGFSSFDNNATTLLQFSTGNEYIQFDLTAMRSDQDSLDSQFKLIIDEQDVMVLTATSGPNQVGTLPHDIIIPPYTNVKVTVTNVSNSSTGTAGVILAGRVYA
jgi:hypothetical protein|tara:strand:- start:178 stop:588 length:411 start_codon:yes stop_codon:yes gene_type:complete